MRANEYNLALPLQLTLPMPMPMPLPVTLPMPLPLSRLWPARRECKEEDGRPSRVLAIPRDDRRTVCNLRSITRQIDVVYNPVSTAVGETESSGDLLRPACHASRQPTRHRGAARYADQTLGKLSPPTTSSGQQSAHHTTRHTECTKQLKRVEHHCRSKSLRDTHHTRTPPEKEYIKVNRPTLGPMSVL